MEYFKKFRISWKLAAMEAIIFSRNVSPFFYKNISK